MTVMEESKQMEETRKQILDVSSIDAILPKTTMPLRLAFPCVHKVVLTVFVDVNPPELELALKK